MSKKMVVKETGAIKPQSSAVSFVADGGPVGCYQIRQRSKHGMMSVGVPCTFVAWSIGQDRGDAEPSSPLKADQPVRRDNEAVQFRAMNTEGPVPVKLSG